MGRSTRPLLLALTALLGAGPAAAATDMVVQLNESQHVHLAGTVANVVVSNPAIADVAVVDSHSVVILAHGFGIAEITVTDRAGHDLLDSRVIVPDPVGRVTLYRGVEATNFQCATRCQAAGTPADPMAAMFSGLATVAAAAKPRPVP
jgi:hypothetical protein